MSFVSKSKVVQVIEHKKNINEYIIEVDKVRRYAPGSFVQLTLESVTASSIWPESRTFSIASYQKNIIRLIIKNVGTYTQKIFDELKCGDLCTLKYPFGELFDKNNVDQNHIFLAGGVGVTPFIGLVEYFSAIGKIENIYLLYSVRQGSDLLHLEYLKATLSDRLKIYVTQVDSEEYISRRFNIDDINKIASSDTNIYICGNTIFNTQLKTTLINEGYNKIYMDEWE